jgi:hypothetical protein
MAPRWIDAAAPLGSRLPRTLAGEVTSGRGLFSGRVSLGAGHGISAELFPKSGDIPVENAIRTTRRAQLSLLKKGSKVCLRAQPRSGLRPFFVTHAETLFESRAAVD